MLGVDYFNYVTIDTWARLPGGDWCNVVCVRMNVRQWTEVQWIHSIGRRVSTRVTRERTVSSRPWTTDQECLASNLQHTPSIRLDRGPGPQSKWFPSTIDDWHYVRIILGLWAPLFSSWASDKKSLVTCSSASRTRFTAVCDETANQLSLWGR